MSREALLSDAVLVEKMRPPTPDDWWRGAVLYEIYWRSFKDSNGDGVGDLPGVCEKLDYIADLGVDAIWLAPFYPSPQEDFGYDVCDHRGVDPLAGTLDDFEALLSGAHDRGLRVLIDFIPIHTSREHPWFEASRADPTGVYGDWYVWSEPAPDGCPPNNWLSSFGGPAWTWDPKRSQYYYHPFLPCQPALNLCNSRVVDALADDLRFWLELGVNGFRMDAVQCLACDADRRANPPARREGSDILLGGGPNNPFRRQLHLFDRDVPEALPVIERFRAVVEGYGADKFLLGELADVDSSRSAEKYTAYGKRFHAVYDFDLINDRGRNAPALLRLRDDHLRTGWLYTVFANHDSKRALATFAPEAASREAQIQAAKALIFLQFTLKGGGAIFQGQELGLTQPELKREDLRDPWGLNLWPDFEGRDGVRTPIPWRSHDRLGAFSVAEPWLPVAPEHLAAAVDIQEADAASPLAFTRRFLHWRKTQPLLLHGGEAILEAPEKLILFDRYIGDDRMRCAVNLSDQAIDYRPPPGDRAAAAPGAVAPGADGVVRLPPYGCSATTGKCEARDRASPEQGRAQRITSPGLADTSS